MLLDQGIPLIENYQKLLKDDLFLQMEKFSNNFIGKFALPLKKYSWTRDPLHQWSRQWEYPFTYSYLEEYIGRKHEDKVNILDAGSGVTFFPYYIASIFGSRGKVFCGDSDKSLPAIFKEINSGIDTPVEFQLCDMQRLPWEGNSFDIIYCISVLEHVPNFESVLNEFYRVLKLGGLLIATFDISIDGDRPIPLGEASKLVSLLESYFLPVGDSDSDKPLHLIREGNLSGILTTDWVRKVNRHLLPWRRPTIRQIIGQLLNLQIPRTFTNLTCFCRVLTKGQK